MESSPCSFTHDSFQLGVSLFILFGMFASYLPQHAKIILTKTSAGINPYFLLLGSVSALCNVINIIITQKSAMGCCFSLGFGLCIESLLGVFQITVQWILFLLVFILFYIYYPEEQRRSTQTSQSPFSHSPAPLSEEWLVSLRVFKAVCIHFFISALVTLLLMGSRQSEHVAMLWAGFNGVFSMALAMVQYVPQIIETWSRKSCGALSIPMMLMQTPGAFLFAYSLASREGTNWTTWITYLVTGSLQGILLFMSISFHYQSNQTNGSSYGPIYIGNVQNASKDQTRPGSSQDSLIDTGKHNLHSGAESTPLLNNHNPVATYEYQQAPHQRTKSLLSKWKGQSNSKIHLVHHSLAANLSERDDTLR
ncbi:hypothetical protein DSO57_1018815 [Entomophthora muscae]|uniref:Uncharacterized protein n=1 Tax=Entomophthora muscae TaxID=34485 RepID=A0ACC2SSY6_9FUNG|nr:hypothetical protein DSO57_1018815 [Entomophthora muscae]